MNLGWKVFYHVLYWMIENRYMGRLHQHPSSETDSETETESLYDYLLLPPCCEESILAFDTKTEKFSAMPHPGPKDQWCKEYPNHHRMHLIGMDGILSSCEVSYTAPLLINIWLSQVKEEEEEKGGECYHYQAKRKLSWIKWRTINIDLDKHRYPFSTSNPKDDVKPAVIVGGELLLEWPFRGVFAFNLKQGTVRRLGKRLRLEVTAHMRAHISSLVPINRCPMPNSEIWVKFDSTLT